VICQLSRKLPLSEEVADQALIGRITWRLRWIVAAFGCRFRAEIVRRARQPMQARPAQRDQHVARQQRAKQQLSEWSKHVNVTGGAASSRLILN
jgi:hypothetical protein